MLKIPFEKKKEMMAIDVMPLTEVRQGLDYLPWVEALLLLNEHFPDLVVDYDIISEEVDGVTYKHIVARLVDIKNNNSSNTLYFPVMDYKHKAKANPDVVDVNNAIMRASVKVIAIETGIGLSLFRKYKEDIPELPKKEANSFDVEQVKEVTETPKLVANPFKKKLV